MSATWRLEVGHVLDELRALPDESVHCAVTSPPYYGLRDYGLEPTTWGDGWHGQLGLEPELAIYVAHLVEVFAEVRRVLRADGTLWLNLGDSYASKPRGSDEGWDKSRLSNPGRLQKAQAASLRRGRRTRGEDAKEKDLLMVPATVALALRADGWWLRKEIIWHKRTPMPENVHDRPASSHEKLYLLAKSPRYFYDAEAVREPDAGYASGNGFKRDERLSFLTDGESRQTDEHWQPGGGRHLRDVWTLSSQPFPEAHFATYPPKLVEPCVLAGTSAHGVCECGAPWRRLVEVKGTSTSAEGRELTPAATAMPGVSPDMRKHRGHHGDNARARRTVGWDPTCDCADPTSTARPVVLDPFAGAATTGVVALRHGRSFVGVELNPEYAELARRRMFADAPLLNALGEDAA